MQYRLVMKNGTVMTPLRAIGLALELAFSIGIMKGFFMVSQADLCQIQVSGTEVFTRSAVGSPWRAADSASVDLTANDAGFALATYLKLVEMLHGLGLNIFRADSRIRGHGYHDLVASSAVKNFVVAGLLSIEIKLRSYHKGFQTVADKLKQGCETRMQLLERLPSQSAFKGVLLVVGWVTQSAGLWSWPKFQVELFSRSGWQVLKSMPRAMPRFFLQVLMASLQWHWVPTLRCCVAKLSQVLQKARRSAHDMKVVARAWNTVLAAEGSALRVKRVKLPGVPGSKPWVIRKALLRKVHRMI